MDVQAQATEIVKKLVDAGFTAYFAGGWVRDYLMGHPSEDIDIATNAPPENILDLFPKTILVGLAFGVVIVMVDGHQFEVATFRRDINYTGGRRPSQIELATPEEDASRRDFTINGMFYDPLEDVVHDFVQGAEDIKHKVIRTIGDPYERFMEDRLRMIRAVRFAARFGFAIDPDTQAAIAANADTLFPAVAMERIWQELSKMSKHPRFDYAMIEMHRLGLLPVIFPQLQHVHLHDIKARVAGFSDFPKDAEAILYVLQLFPEAAPQDVKDLCEYLRTSNAEANLAIFLAALRNRIESDRELEVVDLCAWTHLYAHSASHRCLQVVAANLPTGQKEAFLNEHQKRISLLRRHIDRIVEKTPLINSEILRTSGVPPGKRMGLLIKEAERIAILHDLDNAKDVLDILKTTPVWLQP